MRDCVEGASGPTCSLRSSDDEQQQMELADAISKLQQQMKRQ